MEVFGEREPRCDENTESEKMKLNHNVISKADGITIMCSWTAK